MEGELSKLQGRMLCQQQYLLPFSLSNEKVHIVNKAKRPTTTKKRNHPRNRTYCLFCSTLGHHTYGQPLMPRHKSKTNLVNNWYTKIPTSQTQMRFEFVISIIYQTEGYNKSHNLLLSVPACPYNQKIKIILMIDMSCLEYLSKPKSNQTKPHVPSIFSA